MVAEDQWIVCSVLSYYSNVLELGVCSKAFAAHELASTVRAALRLFFATYYKHLRRYAKLR
jgi:hypothetical protein